MEYLPYYLIYYLFIAYSGNCTAVTIGCTDGTGIYFMLYIASMFKTLQCDIENSFKPYEKINGEFYFYYFCTVGWKRSALLQIRIRNPTIF